MTGPCDGCPQRSAAQKRIRLNRRHYHTKAQAAIADPVLQAALANLQARLGQGAAEGYHRFPEGPDLRLKGHDIRMKAIDHLDILLEALADKIEKNGGHVHFAPDGETAVRQCIEIARRHKVSLAVKGKSMLTEEIGLNPAKRRPILSPRPSTSPAKPSDACSVTNWASRTPTTRPP